MTRSEVIDLHGRSIHSLFTRLYYHCSSEYKEKLQKQCYSHLIIPYSELSETDRELFMENLNIFLTYPADFLVENRPVLLNQFWCGIKNIYQEFCINGDYRDKDTISQEYNHVREFCLLYYPDLVYPEYTNPSAAWASFYEDKYPFFHYRDLGNNVYEFIDITEEYHKRGHYSVYKPVVAIIDMNQYKNERLGFALSTETWDRLLYEKKKENGGLPINEIMLSAEVSFQLSYWKYTFETKIINWNLCRYIMELYMQARCPSYKPEPCTILENECYDIC